MLKKVTLTTVRDLAVPHFIKPKLVEYTREGITGFWECVEIFNSVHILVSKTDSKELLLVKQVRIPVLANNPGTSGEVIEACAGIIDKYPDLPIEERVKLIAIEEVSEELGYQISEVTPLFQPKSSVGLAGGNQYMFYAEVTDEMFVDQSLEPDEDIEVTAIPFNEAQNFVGSSSNTDATTLLLLHWWLLNKGEN